MSKGKNTTLFVSGICCADEEIIARKKLSSLDGVKDFNFNLITQKLNITHTCEEDAIINTLNSCGFKTQKSDFTYTKQTFWEKYSNLIFTTISGLLTLLGIMLKYFEVDAYITIPVFLTAVITGGWRIALKGYKALRNLALDMNFLMTIATVGAVVIGEFAEAAAVIFMFSLALLLESYSVDRTRKAIKSLMAISPSTAAVKNGIFEVLKPVEQVGVGETVIIRPGERIPLDGVIISGSSTINESVITGESIPLIKEAGSQVFAGTINGKGTFEFRVTKLQQDSVLSRIIHLVEEAQTERSESQTFVEKFSRYYTPTVTILAVLIAVIPPLLLSQPFNEWFYRALVLLVIACPCALVISTPVTIVSGLTKAARNGVLIKGGRYLEEIGKLNAIAIDKTGTLTEGRPVVQDIIPLNSYPRDELLKIAAAVESKSEHHVADAILIKAYEEDIEFQQLVCTNFESIPGKGIKATIGDKNYILGNHAFCEEHNLCNPEIELLLEKLELEGKSIVVIIEDQTPIGLISVTDTTREESKHAIRELHRHGIKNIIMLTGDNENTAKLIAKELGIDDVRSQLLPEEKVNAIRRLKAIHGSVGMIGDGINDAPALAASSIGIAMGTAGTDAAIDTANIVLMSDNLSKVSETISLSKRTLRIIKQNITIALITKAVFLTLGACGVATLWMAILADDGAALVVILNGLRLLKHKRKVGDKYS
jgi:Cd2+/Zn2+-exporting ATPase